MPRPQKEIHIKVATYILYFLINLRDIFCISLCSLALLLLVLQFAGDANGYGIRIDRIEPMTYDIPIEPTITTAIPTPIPRRSILREPTRRSVHFEDGNIS